MMLFRDITIIDENFQPCEHMYLGVRDKKIAYIGPEAPQADFGVSYEGKNRLLLPGFVNAHSHLPMSLLRGYGENMSLQDWLNKRIFPFENHLGPDDIYYGTLLGIAEMLRFGIVSSTDMYFGGDSIAKAFVSAGVCCNMSVAVTCFDDSSYYDSPKYQEAEKLYRTYHGLDDGRVLLDLSLHAEYTSTERVARELAEHTKRLGLGMHVHLAETQAEYEACKKRHDGMTPTAYLNSVGLLDTRTTAAHGIYLDDGDIDILRDKKVSVATCPKSNLKLASGVCGVKKLMDAGVNVALGTDSVASNNNLNMIEEIKTFALVHKGWHKDPVLITPAEALAAATVCGARAQGRGDSGLIKEGYRANLTVLDTSPVYMRPAHNILNNLVYAACGTDVVMTIVDGKVLYADGEYKTIDMEKVLYEVENSKRTILGKLAQ